MYNTSYKQKFFNPKEQVVKTMYSTSKGRHDELKKL